MAPWLEKLLEFVRERWPQAAMAVGSALLGWYLGYRRARSRWAQREFLDRLNVSLTFLKDGQLRIRTLLEKPCEEVFLNKVAVDAVLEASRRTTLEDPLLDLPKDDYWYYLNAVLNEVSEKFAEGHLRQSLGLPVECATYLLALTCEAAGTSRTRKVRAMLVRKSELLNMPAEPPKFAVAHHNTRWTTLKQMAAIHGKTPHRLIELELCVGR